MNITVKKIERTVYHTKWKQNVTLIEEHWAKLGILGRQVLVGYKARRNNPRKGRFPYSEFIEFNISHLELIKKAKGNGKLL